ncbi:hypothetical protein L9W92_08685 [Pelotomaculum terephthalicicum JT]|uniref:hypothetical protein n=1 Tax=Pelotomaculum TaxID=191373 RepID=UPI0009C71260|nr:MULTISPECIES: hypothetical protein [Pelotomaculum]MCG9968124.1 hypothetical protein [Pelotomaculum terephthalicicum JT]OPX83979.1 MAG: hypothetical protein A4E54_02944 [Pelotomaculum sp. PtaB.Bin117]OPY62918.1 MAG: hypothetical protein A4E56_00985 [Pelotomaculum sp. PtaU1.Bin065]
MSNIQSGDGVDRNGILVKVRLDFKGTGRTGRFLFGGKTTDKAAEEAREQQLTLFRNVPMQGIHIIDIDVSTEVYTVYDDIANSEVAYAPLVLTIKADSLENIIRFIAREDFRKIEVLDPASISLSHNDIERILFKIYEEMKDFRLWLERKYNLR